MYLPIKGKHSLSIAFEWIQIVAGQTNELQFGAEIRK